MPSRGSGLGGHSKFSFEGVLREQTSKSTSGITPLHV